MQSMGPYATQDSFGSVEGAGKAQAPTYKNNLECDLVI
jgi:hypothetical protein